MLLLKFFGKLLLMKIVAACVKIAPANMAILRHIIVNMIKQEKSFKGSIKTKRLKPAGENGYFIILLFEELKPP
jgi:predicted ABC-type ATPase